MIEIRSRESLGRTRHAALDATHHFSFGSFQRLDRENWGALVALNHVVLGPRAELSRNGLDGVDMLTLVRRGAVAHCGTLGGSCRAMAGEVQLICTGPGIVHGHANPGTRPAEYIELRLRMEEAPESPYRRSVAFPNRAQTGRLALLASGFHQDRPAMALNSPTRVFGARMPAKGRFDYRIAPGGLVYVMSLNGTVAVNDGLVGPLEGAAIAEEETVRIEAARFAEILLVESRPI